MFQGVLDYTKELQNNVQATRAFLRKLRGARIRLVNRIAKAEEQVATMKNPDKYVKSLDTVIRKDALKQAKNVLQGSILQAVRENYEFDWPEYKAGLFKAATDNETYTIRALGGTGWNTRYLVSIDMDDSAGRLNRWAAGVRAYRAELETKVPRKGSKKSRQSAVGASRAWAKIFQSRGSNDKFRTTITKRLGYSGAVAPFWQLLDKGDIPMASDRGGYPTPQKTATNFVSQAEEALEGYIRNIIQSFRNNYESLMGEYRKFLNEAQASLSNIESLIEKTSIEKIKLDRVEQELSRENQIVDRNKLEVAVQKIKDGLLTSGRVELTAKGSPKRVTPSVSTLSDFLTDY